MIPPVIVPVTFKEIAIAIKDSAIGGKDIIVEFEKEISAYNNCEHSIVTYSGRTALYVLLKAYGLKKGDEVIMPAYMCETVSQMLLDKGLKLNFVDIDPYTYNIDIDNLIERTTINTKAILAVHMFGNPCEMQAIMDIAQEKGSIVIEDAAQAMGAEYKNKKVGTIAEAGFFSFGRGKPITAMGGGAIVTNNENIANKCRTFMRDCKKKSSNISTLVKLFGYSSIRNQDIYQIVHKKVRSDEFRTKISLDNLNQKFTDLQAIIGMKQLHMLDKFNAKRKSNADFLTTNLENVENIRLQKIPDHIKSIYLRFPIQVRETEMRNKLKLLLEQQGIESSIVYPMTLPFFYNANKSDYIGAEKVTNALIALPTHPIVNYKHLEIMVNEIKGFANK